MHDNLQVMLTVQISVLYKQIILCFFFLFFFQEAAELAKKKGRNLRPGLPPVAIFWKQQGRRRSTTSGTGPSNPYFL